MTWHASKISILVVSWMQIEIIYHISHLFHIVHTNNLDELRHSGGIYTQFRWKYTLQPRHSTVSSPCQGLQHTQTMCAWSSQTYILWPPDLWHWTGKAVNVELSKHTAECCHIRGISYTMPTGRLPRSNESMKAHTKTPQSLALRWRWVFTSLMLIMEPGYSCRIWHIDETVVGVTVFAVWCYA